MAMRNPIYLDTDLLENAADYYGVLTVDTQFVETGGSATEMKGGVKTPILNAGGGHMSTSQVQTTYAVQTRPVRVMNDVIDAANEAGEIKPSDESSEPLYKDDLVAVTGTLVQSAASSIGSLFGKVMPAMLQQETASGELGGKEAALYSAFLGDATEGTEPSLLYMLETTDIDFPVAVEVQPGMFFKTRTVDDFRGAVTVFGTVDILAEEGATIPMARYLVPGMAPEIRGMLGDTLDEAVTEMLEQIPGQKALSAEDAKELKGPAMIIRPIAIF